MMNRITIRLLSVIVIVVLSGVARAGEFVSHADLKRLDLQSYWSLRLPLEGGETVQRISLLDDSLYALTSQNRALCIHAATGVVRWSNFVGDEGQTVRGPSHASQFVLFTTPGAVRVFDRQSGDAAGAPRMLKGVVIEVVSETATVSIGEEHGVSLGDVLDVYGTEDIGDQSLPIARLRISSVQARTARGRLERATTTEKTRPGCRVEFHGSLPLQEVRLPSAASSAAVSDNKSVFVGVANQRLYCLDLLTGVQHWQLMTPNTVSATPMLRGDTLYLAGQDGWVTSCTKTEKAKNWTFQTEAPIFAELVVEKNQVFVASTDRSLYCLDRVSGKKLWRERFDKPLDTAPVVAGGKAYLSVPGQGLFVLDNESGRRVWNRPEGGQFLLHLGDDVYLLAHDGAGRLLRVSEKNGRKKDEAIAGGCDFALAGLADTSVFLGSASGELACLRPASAPRLQPEQLREALRRDRKTPVADAVKTAAKPGEKKTEAPSRSLFDDDDGLASRSTAIPVGGHGVVAAPGKAESKPTTEAAAKKEGATDEKGGEAEKSEEAGSGEEKPTTEASEGKESGGDEKDAEASGDSDEKEKPEAKEEKKDDSKKDEDDEEGGEEKKDDD